MNFSHFCNAVFGSKNTNLFVISAVFLLASSSQAALKESVIHLQAQVSNMYGKVIDHEFVVTVFEDDAVKPETKPLAIVLHGRAADATKRAAMGRATYRANAQWLAELGFVVAVPTRIGYGVTGGEDVEDSGNCNGKNYPPAYQAAADQTLVVLRHMQQRPDVEKNRTVVIGQSFGGTTAITLAAMNPPGLKATVNFAGGGGGNPATQPKQPCAAYRLEQMFSNYGKTGRIPTLWVYTENDQWMGSEYPMQWHRAYVSAGGAAEFVQFGPNGKDGHGLFTQAPEVWRSKVSLFFKQQGLMPDTD
jgi:dienelactone hydrolase